MTETITETVKVYSNNGIVQVNSSALNPIKEVAVYGLQGMLMYKSGTVNAITYTFYPNMPAGVYSVIVTTEKNINTVKLFFK